ncbi:MAG: 16S rRNA (guanine(527)-N(7))-methyltransferase RsmG [Ignavibacteria bacterium]|nr:16S rRNA (guanine(527)-N(7))-methyltransferase RsmG [Ignavibacteria bacterium]
MELTEFWTILSANGIILEVEQLQLIERYQRELIYWNNKVNLISRKDTENVLENHILHSMSILKYVPIPQNAVCIDVGTGGGLPGIPIKIARIDLRMTLLDSVAKKIKITDLLAKHTGLKNITTICARAEEFAQNKNNFAQFDVVFARGVAKIGTIVAWVKNLLKENGKIVLLKGGDLNSEIRDAKKMFPKIEINEILIDLFGYERFKKDEKKVLVCKLPK